MSRAVHVNDRLQKYTYTCIAPAGQNFAPEFTPDLTPQDMLELGVFAGNYFENEYDEFPPAWFARAKMSDTGDSALNYFGVAASQTRSEWQRKGWIYEEDPRGWFQWYCRYYLGRRIVAEDARQIKRWRQIKRHVSQVKASCTLGDTHCRPRQRQALLHWAYDSRKI